MMKNILFAAVLGLSALFLAGCNSTPKEIKAPCSWDQRSGCGSRAALSHQDQL